MSARSTPGPGRFEVARAYGFFKSWYRNRETEYGQLQAQLNAAHIPLTHDAYLARAAVWTIGYGLVGAIVGVLLGAGMALTGLFRAIDAPAELGGVARVAAANELVLAALATGLVLGVAVALTYRQYTRYYPKAIAARRRREIDIMLPHAILFMYALSQGGTNVVTVFRTLADSTDAYGEVAREFEVLVREMDSFNQNLLDGLREVRDRTPSDRLARFVDDTLGIIDSGGDFAALVESESDTYLQEARSEQRSVIETLSLVAEGYISLLVAGPLFLIIILMVIGLLGGDTIPQVAAIVYLGIPLGSLIVVLGVDLIVGAIETETGDIEARRRESTPDPPDDPRTERYLRRRRRKRLRTALSNPLRRLYERPTLSLLVTVPSAALVVALLVVYGGASLTLEGLLKRPVIETIELVALPFIVVAVPLAAFEEARQRRRKQVTDRFPEMLSAVSNVNEIGLSLAESLEVVGRRREDRLGAELSRLRNDMDWYGDLQSALARFANRLGVSEISRTTKLLIEAHRAGGDLHRALGIAADDATAQRQLRRDRSQEIASYLAIVVIGFLVYLGVIVMLDQFYLQGIARTVEGGGGTPAGDPGLARSFASLDVNTFRLLLFHSTIVQGIFSGLVAGKMADNRALSGLKLSIVLVLVAVLTFLVI